MKKIFLAVLIGLVLMGLWKFSAQTTEAQTEIASEQNALPSPNVVISQFFGGGGRTGTPNAPYTNDFVELFNRGSAPVNLNGWTVQYASATGSNWIVTNLTNTTLQPGQYYLIQFASDGTVGNPLPTPDLIAPVTPGGFILNLSGTTGKLALVNSTAQLPAQTCPLDASIIDLVGYGASANCAETTRTADLSITTAGIRNGNGCNDTDNNVADFTIAAPTPRNTATPVNVCSGTGNNLVANGSAIPSTVLPGATTLLRVTVFPATTPPSTGITVNANLTAISGSANQQFFDNGTNGDVTPNDNIFSYQYTIPTTAAGGTIIMPATAADAQSRTANTTITLLINAPPPNDNPLTLGNPSNATTDVAFPANYLMPKPQYTLSYNRDKGTPNWVAWRLDTTWLGTTDRQDDYRPDPDLPAGWYQVQSSDYSGSGFDRGHMCPSGDRTRSVEDNSATFLMTNFVPQLPANNQGPWNDFENYCRTLANAGNELYIFSGGQGSLGTIANGRVTIPAVTWKVVLVLPNGSNDLQRVNKSTRTIAIVVPNQGTVTNNWRLYRTTVRRVEHLTGLNFFSRVSPMAQQIMENRIDRQ
jgi:endonuclease G